MDDKVKQRVKLGLIGMSLVLAAFLLWRNISNRRPAGIETIEAGQMILTLCANPSCKAQSEMGKRAYYEEADKLSRQHPQMSQAALICPKCDRYSVVRAVKCPKCGQVFRYGVIQREAPDRCPKCRYSQTEEERKRRAQ